jgi:DNA-directed RNA polymerase subunit N (RpoN/RPB10)
MLLLSCVTCNAFIGQYTIDFENKKKNICDNPELSQEKKDNQISDLIKNLPLRYCCKMRFMTYKDSVEFIIPAKD